MQIDAIIYKYLTGNTTPVEECYLLDWIKQSSENKQLFYDRKALWQISRSYSHNPKEQEIQTNQSLNKLNDRIDGL